MFYTRLILLFLLLSGCATGPTQITPSGSKNDAQIKNTSDAQKLADENPITLYRNAITELNNNNLDTAKENFLKIIKIQPNLAGPWANLALINIKQERYKEAEKNIQTALEKNPEMSQALNIAGYIEKQKGNIIAAKKFYEQAIAKKPDYALAHYNLALLYDIYLQNIKKAVEHYQRYLSLLDHEDKKVKNWVNELKLNIKSGDT